MAKSIPTIRVIWPEHRLLSADDVLMYARDAFANGEADREPEDVADAIAILNDLGHFTFHKSAVA
jgi:hypothetical protein